MADVRSEYIKQRASAAGALATLDIEEHAAVIVELCQETAAAMTHAVFEEHDEKLGKLVSSAAWMLSKAEGNGWLALSEEECQSAVRLTPKKHVLVAPGEEATAAHAARAIMDANALASALGAQGYATARIEVPDSTLERYALPIEMEVQKKRAPSGNELLNTEMIDLPDDVLQEIVDGIVSAVPTKAIYVFGSFARGEENSRSDIDIFIVTDDPSVRSYVHGVNARSAIRDAIYRQGLNYDLVCTDAEVFEREKDKTGALSRVVQREGVKLYERRDRLAY